jgi:hypothetical protein
MRDGPEVGTPIVDAPSSAFERIKSFRLPSKIRDCGGPLEPQLGSS